MSSSRHHSNGRGYHKRESAAAASSSRHENLAVHKSHDKEKLDMAVLTWRAPDRAVHMLQGPLPIIQRALVLYDQSVSKLMMETHGAAEQAMRAMQQITSAKKGDGMARLMIRHHGATIDVIIAKQPADFYNPPVAFAELARQISTHEQQQHATGGASLLPNIQAINVSYVVPTIFINGANPRAATSYHVTYRFTPPPGSLTRSIRASPAMKAIPPVTMDGMSNRIPMTTNVNSLRKRMTRWFSNQQLNHLNSLIEQRAKKSSFNDKLTNVEWYNALDAEYQAFLQEIQSDFLSGNTDKARVHLAIHDAHRKSYLASPYRNFVLVYTKEASNGLRSTYGEDDARQVDGRTANVELLANGNAKFLKRALDEDAAEDDALAMYELRMERAHAAGFLTLHQVQHIEMESAKGFFLKHPDAPMHDVVMNTVHHIYHATKEREKQMTHDQYMKARETSALAVETAEHLPVTIVLESPHFGIVVMSSQRRKDGHKGGIQDEGAYWAAKTSRGIQAIDDEWSRIKTQGLGPVVADYARWSAVGRGVGNLGGLAASVARATGRLTGRITAYAGGDYVADLYTRASHWFANFARGGGGGDGNG